MVHRPKMVASRMWVNGYHGLSRGAARLNRPLRAAMVRSSRWSEDCMTERPVSEMSFEEAMKELETVVGQLERGDVALEQSIKLYERGAELKKRCEAKLKEAEEKVAAITLDGEGQPVSLKPVEGL
jgi:exodeoxyribonuclease VII small subunit